MSKITVKIESKDSPENRGWSKGRHSSPLEYQWITKDGRTLKLEEIPDDHLFNIINYVNRLGLPTTKLIMMNEATRRGFIIIAVDPNGIIQWAKIPKDNI